MRIPAFASIVLLSVSGLTGCSAAPFSILAAGGEQAGWLAVLGWSLIALMLGITIVMGALVLWGALRRRGTLAESLPVDIDGGKQWILVGGVLVPVIVLSTLFAVTVGTLGAMPDEAADADLEIEVTAHQWWWEVDYLYDRLPKRFSTANEIHIPVGRPVSIRLKSSDVIHSFWVPRLHGKLDAIPGHENRLVVEATQPGVYWGECAEYCGVQHANMKLIVVAEPAEAFDAWARRQREPANPPSTPQLMSGREAFESYACGTCHTIRGTRARGGVAPDLTHFGSRLLIAGTLENSRPHLQAWITNAQSLKPGVKMPNLEQFDGETLNALAAYLESLE